MMGRRKKTKTCDEGLHEDRISQLPDPLIYEILSHLPTKDVVKTSALSTKWTSLWKYVPGLDLDSREFSNLDAFVSFAERFIFDPPVDSWISKIRFRVYHPCCSNYSFTPLIDALTMRRIQHLDVDVIYRPVMMPLSIYTCETLVHLGLHWVTLADAEFVSLPCLKIMQLDCVNYLNKAILEKLISSSPVLEDLTIVRLSEKKFIQVRSQTLKRIHIDETNSVVIDAPLLQCLRTRISLSSTRKNYNIINSSFPAKLDIGVVHKDFFESKIKILDILTDISKVRDLVISSEMWKVTYHSKSRRLCQFRYLYRLNARFRKSDLEMLPTLLERCPELQSLILEFVEDRDCSMPSEKNIQPKVLFSTVPGCLVSSLRFVELKSSISVYGRVMKLVRYILMNSTILEKLRLDINCSQKAKRAFLTELVAMRCSKACEIIVI